HLQEHFEVVLVRDRALDQYGIDVLGVLLHVHDRREHYVGDRDEVDQVLVEVEKRHVTARTPAEPDGGDSQTFHCFFSRALTRNSSFARSRSISATVVPLRKMAPVGQAMKHFPHDVHVTDSPHGWAMSVTTFAFAPRPETSQVWAPSNSSHARTQRVQRMQRLWSIPNRSWLASTSRRG